MQTNLNVLKMLGTAAVVALAVGCSGTNGSSCTVEQAADGSTTISCEDGRTATINPVTNGKTSLVRVSTEAPGANCAGGGQRIEYGIDDDGSGGLQASEVDGTVWVCDGQDGQDGGTGPAGPDGRSTLFAASAESAGANCTAGGTRLDYGVDDDGNGTLDPAEIDGTVYVCTGVDGGPGRSSLIATSNEAPGANCPQGGKRVDHGVDDNGNGTLDTAEIDGTAYVCDGAGGLQSLVNVTPEAVGTNCAAGGQRIDWGIDDSSDGTLQAGEIDGTQYVCNGLSGLCGNGVVNPGEEVDPPTSPFMTISINPATCRWDFTGVRQLYCNGTWTWDAVNGCQQADADMFCKLLMDNVNSTATSWTTSTAIDAPGFNGNQASTGTVINVDRGVTITNGVRYKDVSLLTDGFHGPGSVILDPICTNP